MVKLFVGNRKRGLKEITIPQKEWQGKFVMFVLLPDEKALFVSILDDYENRNDPQDYDHGLCQYAVNFRTELKIEQNVSFGGGYCAKNNEQLKIYGTSGEYGRYSANTIQKIKQELIEIFNVKEIKLS